MLRLKPRPKANSGFVPVSTLADEDGPTLTLHFLTTKTKDQLFTLLHDASDWGPFDLVALEKVPDPSGLSTETYRGTFKVTTAEAKTNPRRHMEWGLMLMKSLDRSFPSIMKDGQYTYIADKRAALID